MKRALKRTNYRHALPLVLVVLFLIGVAGKCDMPLADGTYTGKFKVVYDTATFTGVTTLRLHGDTYHCEGNDNRIPAGGSGTFAIRDNTIIFHDENMWTADFDWNLILKGEYHYILYGKNLKLTMRKDGAMYEYDLLKM